MTNTLPRIEQLKAEAKALGITHSGNIGVDTLDKKIKLFKAQNLQSKVEEPTVAKVETVKPPQLTCLLYTSPSPRD